MGDETGYERFAPVKRAIDVGGQTLTFWLPPDLDALIDAEAFERDERIPYWANVWESALVLAEDMAAIALLDTRTSSFFDHRDPAVVRRLGEMRRPT